MICLRAADLLWHVRASWLSDYFARRLVSCMLPPVHVCKWGRMPSGPLNGSGSTIVGLAIRRRQHRKRFAQRARRQHLCTIGLLVKKSRLLTLGFN
jgi:hypothetical protein